MHIFAFVFLTVVACATGSVPGKPTPAHLPKQGEPCDSAGKCAEKLECVKYYGIAGARGPQFSSCEIRCGDKGACPAGQSCRTIADGPGRVCRPSN